LKRKALGSLSIFELTSEYEKVASRYGQAFEACDPKTANRQSDILGRLEQELKQRPVEGRAAILSLMRSKDKGVRLCAAGAALRFAPDMAEPVLKELSTGPGLMSLTAEVALQEWRKGNIDREDWP